MSTSPPNLTIQAVETIPIRVDLDQTYRGSYYQMPRRCTIVTRLFTEQGVVGECYNADWDQEQGEVLRIIRDELSRVVVGRDAFAIEECWEAMYRICLDQLRDRRLAVSALSCLDTAMWDAIGKAVGVPLYRLWGGYRSAMPAIAIGGYYSDDPRSIDREMAFYADTGFQGMKFKIGGRSPEEDAARLRRAFDAAPDSFVFMVDANQGWSVDEAVRFVRLTEDFVELRWFEEPCRWPDDRRSMATLRTRAGVRVAAGQSEISPVAMRDLMADGAIDVSNFDASWGGGPTAWRRVAALASAYGVSLGHHEEIHLSSHLLASVPHGTFVESFGPERDPVWWQMVANRPPVTDGAVAVPVGPGLGWELDEQFIKRYRADR